MPETDSLRKQRNSFQADFEKSDRCKRDLETKLKNLEKEKHTQDESGWQNKYRALEEEHRALEEEHAREVASLMKEKQDIINSAQERQDVIDSFKEEEYPIEVIRAFFILWKF